MSTSPSRVYVGRLTGLKVFDPAGDQVGSVRDLVAVMRQAGRPPRFVGMVVEVFGRRAVFLPMTRVTTIDGTQVITTGVVNMRRFEKRSSEVLVLGEMLELGPGHDAGHRSVGEAAAAVVDLLVAVGHDARGIIDGAVEAGLDPTHIHHAVDAETAMDTLRPRLRDGDIILVKASRGIELDRLVAILRRELGDAP